MNWYNVLGLFFPNHCLVCGTYQAATTYVCENCMPAVMLERSFQIKLGKNAYVFQVQSVLPNLGYTNRCINRFKFSGKTAYCRKFVGVAAKLLDTVQYQQYDAVTYVPMLPAAKRERGYNQAQLLAKAIAKELGLPCIAALNKKNTKFAQHTLSAKERQENAKTAFEPRCDNSRQNLILVDDIITTGATMRACAAALYKSGAKHVVGFCAVDTPPPLQKE